MKTVSHNILHPKVTSWTALLKSLAKLLAWRYIRDYSSHSHWWSIACGLSCYLNLPRVWFHSCQGHAQNKGNELWICWLDMCPVWHESTVHRYSKCSCAPARAFFSAYTKSLRKHPKRLADWRSVEPGAGVLEQAPVKSHVLCLWTERTAPSPPAVSLSRQTPGGGDRATAKSAFLSWKVVLTPG